MILTPETSDDVDAYNHQDPFDRARKDPEIELTCEDDKHLL